MQMEVVTTEESLWRDYHADPSGTNRNRLAEHYYPWVCDLANRRLHKMPPTAMIWPDDLVSYGMLGLFEAISRFEPARRLKFKTYATPRVNGSILDGIRELDFARPARRNRKFQHPEVRHISAFRERHADEDGRSKCPIDQPHSYTDPDRLETRDLVKRALVGLSQTERIIVISYYCLDQTMKQIGESLDLSESRVSQLMKEIKSRMRERFPNGPGCDE